MTLMRFSISPKILVVPTFLLSLIVGVPLQAQEGNDVLRIHRADLTRYPEVVLTVSVRPPYPENVDLSNSDNVTSIFHITEKFRDRDLLLNPDSVAPVPVHADHLYLVIVLDYTRSMSVGDFARMKADTRYILESLREGDMAAIYSFNSEPRLESPFTGDLISLKSVLSKLERKGNVTHVFDALHSGIVSSQRALGIHPDPAVVRQSAVIIFTDGKDEGSSLKSADLDATLSIGSQYRIPVFSVLYGKSENRSFFERLARKSGGSVLKRSSRNGIEPVLDRLRRIPAHTYRLSYMSAVSPLSMPLPGEMVNIHVTIRGNEGPGEANLAYSLPILTLYSGIASPGSGDARKALAIVLLSLGMLLLLVIATILLRRHSRSSRGKKRAHASTKLSHGEELSQQKEEDSEILNERIMQETRLQEEVSADDQNLTAADEEDSVYESAPSAKKKSPRELLKDSELVESDDGTMATVEMGSRQESSAPQSRNQPYRVLSDGRIEELPPVLESDQEIEYVTGTGALPQDDRRQRYLNDYSYHILQLALRQGERYTDATLFLKSPAPHIIHREFDLFLENTVIGSGTYSNIRLSDPSVSPIHAKIRRIDGKYVIYDMVSRSGTYVNKKKLLRPRALHDGDEIQIGRLLVAFKGAR